MKLYEAPNTPSTRRVTIFMKELGIEIERESVNLREGENITDEFKALSVNGKVPVLQLDDGHHISESVAICRYLDASHGYESGLFGDTPKAQADVEMWHRIIELEGLYALFQAFRNLSGMYSDRERCVKAWGEESKLRVIEFLPKLEERLKTSAYIAGEQFTIVDITGFLFVSMCSKALEIDVLSSYPAIQAWHQTVSQRPAFLES